MTPRRRRSESTGLPAGVAWMVSRLLPESYAEAMLADLDELLKERATRGASRLATLAWCWCQVVRPATLLLALSLARRAEPARGRAIMWVVDVLAGMARGWHLARRSPARLLLAVSLLGGGAGTCAAVFAAVHAVYLRPLPLPDPDRLLWVYERSEASRFEPGPVAPANVFRWREAAATLDDIAFYWPGCTNKVIAAPDAAPERLCGSRISGNLFDVLGLTAELGRAMNLTDSWSSESQVVVLTNETWRNRFGADPEIVGRSIVLDHVPHVVAGVMPASVVFPEREVELWIPLRFDPTTLDEQWFRASYQGVARLAEGVDKDGALSELTSVQRELQRLFPAPGQNEGVEVGVAPLSDLFVSSSREIVVLLFGAVALLLAIAMLNLASFNALSLEARRREFDLRSALGASHGVQYRGLLGENVLLVGAGTVLALALTNVLLTSFVGSPIATDLFGHTPPVMGPQITVFLGLTAGLMLTVLEPASRRVLSGTAVTGGARVVASAGFVRRARAVVTAQVALAVVLALTAVLLTRTVLALAAVDPGFDTSNRIVATIELTDPPYGEPEQHHGFFRELVRRLEALPEVEAAAVTSQPPLSVVWRVGSAWVESGGTDPVARDVVRRNVGTGYFETMGIPILSGRDFGDGDSFDAPPVAIVNRSFARGYFDGVEPVGRSIALADPAAGDGDRWIRVVGVVGDERQSSPGLASRPEIFTPYEQMRWWTTRVMVHTLSEPESIVVPMRQIVRELDPSLPVYDVKTLEEIRRVSVARERVTASFVGIFAAAALLLSLAGVYGVAAIVARFRQRELALRAALGAAPTRVSGRALSTGLRPALVGLGVGVILAAAGSRFLESLLFGVEALDPLSFAIVGLGFTALATLAGLRPAVRAMRYDLARLLKEER